MSTLKRSLQGGYKKKKISEALFMTALLIYPAINWLVFEVYLSASSILMAFQQIDRFTYEPYWVGFDNFVYIFQQFGSGTSEFTIGLRNNLLSYGLGLLIGTPLNFCCGFWAYKKCPGSGIYRTVTMLPSIISGLVIGLMFKQFAYNLPLIMNLTFGVENFPALMTDPDWTLFTTLYYGFWGGVGVGIIYYSNAMNAISDELVESVVLEGCGWFQEFIYLTFPMIMPTWITLFITGFPTMVTSQGPLFMFWGYEAPRETYRLGYVLFQKTMKGGVGQYGITTAMNLLITGVMFPLTMLVKAGLDKLNPMND